MLMRQRNLLHSEKKPMEERVLLAAATSERGDRNRRARDVENQNDPVETQSGGQNSPDGTQGGNSSANPFAGFARIASNDRVANLPAEDPAGPVRGQRRGSLVDAGISAADFLQADETNTQPQPDSSRIDPTKETVVGFVATGHTLYLHVPTEESIAAEEDRQNRRVGNDAISDAVGAVTGRALLEGLSVAANELTPNETVAPLRFQQIENNATARAAERVGQITFVNNDLDSRATGPTRLYINLPSQAIDGRRVTHPTVDRDPIEYTYEDIVNGRRSTEDFQLGDSVIVPASIVNEGRRLLGVSRGLGLETSATLRRDGSPLVNRRAFQALGVETNNNDGRTVIGEEREINLVNFKDTEFGEEENSAATIHAHRVGSLSIDGIEDNRVDGEFIDFSIGR